MEKVLKKQIAKLKKFHAANSHMYEALFGENSNDACLAESGPEAEHLTNEFTPNDTFTASAPDSHMIQQLRM